MGRVNIHDDSGVRRFRLAGLDGEYSLQIRWPSRASALAAGTSTAADSDGPVAAAGGTGGSRASDASDAERHGSGSDASDEPSDDYAWLAVVPFVATLLGLLVGAVFGFGVFDTGTPGDPNLAPYALLVPYFFAGLAGTLWLFRDAAELAAANAAWQPNPWAYVLGGALVLELLVALPVLRGAVTAGIVPYLFGGFVLAAVLSSVVAGPVYLLQRRRYLGTP